MKDDLVGLLCNGNIESKKKIHVISMELFLFLWYEIYTRSYEYGINLKLDY